jgi:hypothetical protein
MKNMNPMNDSYGIPRGSMPSGKIEASMCSRFPVRDAAGNEDTIVYAAWDGETLRFSPATISEKPITLEEWESHATTEGKEFAQKIRAGYRPSLHE